MFKVTAFPGLSRRRCGLVLGHMVAATALTACGFTLRRPAYLYLDTISLRSFDARSEVGPALRQAIERQGRTAVLEAQAQVAVERVLEVRESLAVAATATGQVREVTLRYRFVFRAVRRDGTLAIADTEIVLERPLSFDESLALAKESEADLLYRDMVQEIVIRVLRRLSTVEP